jgi:hypothetical protein
MFIFLNFWVPFNYNCLKQLIARQQMYSTVDFYIGWRKKEGFVGIGPSEHKTAVSIREWGKGGGGKKGKL